MTAKTTSASHRLLHVDVLRGLAMLGVIWLHAQASLPGLIVYSPEWRWIFAILDQILRFCVPVFIACSGYALAHKYAHHAFSSSTFWRKRAWPLLPVYLTWSFGLIVLLQLVPAWSQAAWSWTLPNIWRVVWSGAADYHLYFIPLLLQLYVWFWAKEAFKIPAAWWIGASALLQIFIFWLIAYDLVPSSWSFFQSDQGQYWWFGSWAWYLSLGWWLGNFAATHQDGIDAEKRRKYKIAILITGAMACLDAGWQIRSGIDPIDALKFTRWPVFLYATSWILYGLSAPVSTVQQPGHILLARTRHAVAWIGHHSLIIFLGHTVALRILFGWFEHTLTITQAITAITGLGILWQATQTWEHPLRSLGYWRRLTKHVRSNSLLQQR
jgi:peptidoglycan/LPS O-acetylase OafA/YrhL